MAKKKEDDSKLFAFLAVFLSIAGFIIALLAKREDKYVLFYAKQSLILFLTGIMLKVITVFLVITIIGIVLGPVVWAVYFILWLIALLNSISGKKKETLIIGEYARKISL